jgi:hypothetical protein
LGLNNVAGPRFRDLLDHVGLLRGIQRLGGTLRGRGGGAERLNVGIHVAER